MTTSTKRQARADAYITVPCRIADEPQTQAVYNSDHLLAAYVRAFIMADRAYPSHLPAALLSKRDREALLAAGLLDVPEPGRYTIPGLDAKRTAASAHASHAAGVQWGAAKPAQVDAPSIAPSIAPSNAQGDAQGDAQVMPEGMPEGMPTETETETDLLPTVGETIPAVRQPTSSAAAQPGPERAPLDDVVELRRGRGGWSQPNREAEIKAKQSASRQAAKNAPGR